MEYPAAEGILRGPLQDIQSQGYFLFVAFTDGYLITKQIDHITSYIVYFIDVDDIRPVDLEESGADEFFLHILQRAISDITLARRYEFDIVPHTFEEKNIVLFQFDEFVFGFDEQEVGIGHRGAGDGL